MGTDEKKIMRKDEEYAVIISGKPYSLAVSFLNTIIDFAQTLNKDAYLSVIMNPIYRLSLFSCRCYTCRNYE